MSDDLSCGCSPDGFVNPKSLLEIKSLKTENHVKTLVKLHKKEVCPADYYPQVQGQLMITQSVYCDLMFYHPHLPHAIVRVWPDIDFHIALKRQIVLVNRERDKILEVIKRQASK